MIDAMALAAIRLYRRHLSPRKGFRCAWGATTGRDSCSGVGLRAVRRAGWWRGSMLLRRQFDRCLLAGAAGTTDGGPYRRLRPLANQRGDCDLGCGGCIDSGCAETAARALDCLSLADCCALPCRRADRDFKRRAAAVRERARARQEARNRRREAAPADAGPGNGGPR